LVAALVVMPMAATGVAIGATRAFNTLQLALAHKKPPPKPKPGPADYCFNTASYWDLTLADPPGLVTGDIDFGPFVLALTPHSTLSAPYHRMNWGIMAARGILTAAADDPGPDGAEARARKLGVSYVLNCQVHHINADRAGIPANSLQAVMDRDDWPDWLELISDEKAPIHVFRVLPPEPPTPSP
jgi:hypothetical protein